MFDDIAKYRDDCKYSDCLHINEDECNVLNNIDKIDSTRYESYLAFIDEAKEYKERIKYEGKKQENNKKFVHNKHIAKISREKTTKCKKHILKQNIYKDFENEDE